VLQSKAIAIGGSRACVIYHCFTLVFTERYLLWSAFGLEKLMNPQTNKIRLLKIKCSVERSWWEMKNVYKILVEKLHKKEPLEVLICR
jgi:hypothetical protein